jgi:hypothetical protein
MKRFYNKNSKLDFGMYKGYELGIVYVFDPSYIDWCINNIEKFHVSDLNELKEIGIINEKLDWQYKLIGDPSLIPNIDAFETFKELTENVDLGEKRYKFNEETLNKKEENSFSKNYGRRKVNLEEEINFDLPDNVKGYAGVPCFEEDSGYDVYEDDPRYEKYGGYNGYSDDAIDSAFEGDPMNTWNVD